MSILTSTSTVGPMVHVATKATNARTKNPDTKTMPRSKIRWAVVPYFASRWKIKRMNLYDGVGAVIVL